VDTIVDFKFKTTPVEPESLDTGARTCLLKFLCGGAGKQVGAKVGTRYSNGYNGRLVGSCT